MYNCTIIGCVKKKWPRRCWQHPGARTKRSKLLIEKSLAHPKRTVFFDQRHLEEIAELTGIEYRVLASAFMGETKDLTLRVVKTAVEVAPSS
jgi:hypothetical protein